MSWIKYYYIILILLGFEFSRQKNYLSTMLFTIITNDQVSHIFIKFRAINLNAYIFFPLPFRFGASLLFIFSFVFSAPISFPLLFRIIPAFRPSVFYGWFRYGFSVFVNTPIKNYYITILLRFEFSRQKITCLCPFDQISTQSFLSVPSGTKDY